MMLLVVNFHYIGREDKYSFPGIHPASIEMLDGEIESLSKDFTFISQKDLIEAVEGRTKLPPKCCLLTFDDGLISQAEDALPILKKKGVPAVFFVNTLPLQNKKACLVHKIHWLRAHSAPEEFLLKLDDGLKPFGKSLKSYNVSEKDACRYYPYDDKKTACLKLVLTNLPKDIKYNVINNLFQELVPDEKSFCENFYMSLSHIRELSKLSFLGVHSDRHLNLADIDEEEMKDDISRSVNFLSDFTQTKIQSISYPHGDLKSVSKKISNFCQSIGLKIGFTTERSFNRTLKEPLLFARLTCNDVPNGKSSLFKIRNDKIEIINKVTLSRQYYFKE